MFAQRALAECIHAPKVRLLHQPIEGLSVGLLLYREILITLQSGVVVRGDPAPHILREDNMEQLVAFLQELTGKAIEVSPQAIEGLIAMKATKLLFQVQSMSISTGIFFVISLALLICGSVNKPIIDDNFYGRVPKTRALACWILSGLTFITTMIMTGQLVSNIKWLLVFRASPEIYVIKDLLSK